MIVLTGVSGGLGRATLDHLLMRVPRERIVVTARNPDKVRNIADAGIQVRRCDFDDSNSIRAALAGAERFHFIPSHDEDERRLTQNKRVIDVAADLNIPHVYYASQANAAVDAPLGVYRGHAHTENYLKASGLGWTMLRNGYYMEDVILFLGNVIETGVIDMPLDGPIPFASRRDYGEAHAVVLAKGGYAGETLNFTGSKAWDLAGIAGLLTRFLGREIKRVVIEDDIFTARLRKTDMSEEWIAWSLEGFKQPRNNGVATVWPTLGEMLKRDPLPLESRIMELLATAQVAGIHAVASTAGETF